MLPPSLPDPFGPFRIVRKLGAGGMGDVYLAHDTRLSRTVALKIPRFLDDNPATAERFRREARIAAQLPPHPSLCPVFDVGQIDGVHFLAMAYIEGAPLSRYLGEACQWHPVHAVSLVCQLAEALALLHERGVVHRDLKASNVLIQPDGRAVLLDFGLARSFVSGSNQVSATGQVLGTPGSMAPEQLLAEEHKIGPATDVWALGVLLYLLLTGRPPFGHGNPTELGVRVLCVPAHAPSFYRPDLDPRLDALCGMALAKNPDERPANARVFLHLLQQFVSVPPAGGIVTPPTPAPTDMTRVALPGGGMSLLALGALSLALVCVAVGLAIGYGRDEPVASETTPTPEATPSTKPETAEPPPRSISFHRVDPIILTAGEEATLPLQLDRVNANGALECSVTDKHPGMRWDDAHLDPGATKGKLVIHTTTETKPQRYVLQVEARQVGAVVGETKVTVEVRAAPQPTLKLLVPQEKIKLVAGKGTTVEVELQHRDLKGEVRLTVAPRIPGVEAEVNPPEKGDEFVTLKVTTDFALDPGNYELKLCARADPKAEDTRTITLVVEAPPQSVTNAIGMKLVWIPRGKMKMGTSANERPVLDKELRNTLLRDGPIAREPLEREVKELLDPEQPQHTVEITRPFYMGTYEVTQAQYKRVMGKNPSGFCATGLGKEAVRGLDTSNFPVESVSWEEAAEFCYKLSQMPEEKKAGRVYRLPTAAEWEHACRGSKGQTFFHCGDALDATQANFIGTRPFGTDKAGEYLRRPTVVGSYKPNEYGLYDMHGNVWEWCSDWYDKDYYKDGPESDPQGPKGGVLHERRGGCWHSQAIFCRTAFRMGRPVDDSNRIGHIGFRVVCVPTPEVPQ